MHKTQLTLALATLGIAGFAASQQASAQIPTANSGNSDLIFVAVDTKTNETFYEDLGILALPTSNLATQNFNLATTGGTAYSTFAANVGTDALNFAVFGGGNKNGGAGNPLGLNSYSVTVGGTATPATPSNGTLANYNLIDQNIIGPLNSGSAAVTSNKGYDVTSSGLEYTDANGDTSVNGNFGGVTTAAAGSSNAFYNFTQYKTATSTTASPSTETLLGTFTFSGSTLGYTAAGTSTVPLPAAFWLLGSGLFGLVGIGRRRAA